MIVKILKWALLIFVCIFVIGLFYLFTTTDGLKKALSITQRMGVPIKIKNLSGSLMSTIQAEQITYKTNTINLSAKKISLAWDPLDLLRANIHITKLNITGLRAVLKSNQTQSQETTGNNWLGFKIDYLNCQDCQIKTPWIDQVIKTPGLLFSNDNNDFKLKAQITSPGQLNVNINKLKKSIKTNINWQALTLTQNNNTLILNSAGKLIATGSLNKFTFNTQINNQGGQVPKFNGNLTGFGQYNKKLNITQGTIKIPKIGLVLNNIKLAIKKLSKKTWQYTGKLNSGQEQLNINGKSKITQKGLDNTWRFEGQNVTVFNTKAYQIIISPDLTLRVAKPVLNLKGAVTIVRAKISPQSFKSTLTLPDDVRYEDKHSKQKDKTNNPWQISSDINLNLGNQVNLNILGLKGKLNGQLHLIDSPNTPTLATGQLVINQGKYTAYGQDLVIDYGRLLFSGSQVNNPGLNLQASKQVQVVQKDLGDFLTNTTRIGSPQLEKIKIGIQVTGTLKKPRVSLFSDPPDIQQADILSYLVLGRPSTSVGNAADAQLLASAVTALDLGGNSSQQITQQLQQNLGVSISVESSPYIDTTDNTLKQEATVVLTKALSPRLYLSYGIGLTQGNRILRSRYKINKKLTLQAENTGSASGVDLLYTIERK